METKPVRIQLSRKRGFNLQAVSLAINGLPAVNVARPNRWGNPWKIGSNLLDCNTWRICKTASDCVQGFRQSVDWDPNETHIIRTEDSVLEVRGGYGPEHRNRETAKAELRGKNLACWCKPGDPCHADVLLEIANA